MAKRVVTGHNDEGKAVFVSEGPVEPVTASMVPGYEFRVLWGGDAAPEFPDDGSRPEAPAYFPSVGGFRFITVTFPPDSQASLDDLPDIEAALAEVETLLPGMASHMEPDAPGMHTSATIDYDYLVSGRLVLELDDGATVELGPGDCVIQNGTRHAWRNPFDEPAVMVVTLLGAHHRNVP
ncbi:MAG: cupin domain-containing protein [Myxococcota bacterium]|nr:cupin domain-containing protein [Myxococcota bacterium]